MRRDPLVKDEIYHICNRGTDKRKIFLESNDYQRFFSSLIEFNTEMPSWKINSLKTTTIEVRPRLEDQLVDIITYCLNPNHFHLLLKQKKDFGITKFMRKVITGYTMYFNKKNDRSGVLFQGKFKSARVNSNEYLLYLSAYINCNSQVHGISDARGYRWCSFGEYRGFDGKINCKKEIVLGQFRKYSDYEKYALDQIVKIKENKEMRRLLLEGE